MHEPLPSFSAAAQDAPAAAMPGLTTDGPGWSIGRKLATLLLLATASWAGMAGLVLGLVKLVQWEAEVGLLRYVPL